MPYVVPQNVYPQRPLNAVSARHYGAPLGRMGSVLIFLIPASGFVEFTLIGQMFLSDLMVLILTPMLLAMAKGKFQREMKWLLIALAFYLVGAILTDMIVGTPFTDYTRGWARIAFFFFYMITFYLLAGGNIDRIALCALGYAVGQLIWILFFPSDTAADDTFKFGLGGALAIIIGAGGPLFFIRRWSTK